MTHLRSPSVHHLDRDAWSLRRFAGPTRGWKPGLFAAPYDRPSLALFDAHSDHVIDRYGLRALHIRGHANQVSVDCAGATITTSEGQLQADNVVLAIGAGNHPQWPSWAPRNHDRVSHVFAKDASLPPAGAGEAIAIVGAGISAAQVALRLVKEGQRVHLVARHALRQHQFDSDPGWLGPRFMTRFKREQNTQVRRTMIGQARHRGSMPPDIRRALRRAIERGDLVWHEGEVVDVSSLPNSLQVRLSNGNALQLDRILLATGFSSQRPGGELLDRLIESAKLPCAGCGYPLVDASLRWHPRVYVTGPLAELELGPSARNIAGARSAGDRIAQAALIGPCRLPHAVG